MTRDPRAAAMTEAELQQQVIGLCRDLGLYHYHPWTSVNSAAGWPDSVIIGKRVLFRELKSESGRLTREQAEVGRKLEAAGQNWRVWRPSHLYAGTIARELAAAELLLDAERAIEPRLDREAGDLASIVDWASKQIGHVARLAGLLHLAAHLRDGWGRQVSEDTMRAALEVGEYYTAHALAAFDHMGTDQVRDDARVLYRWIERTGAAQFTRRDAFNGVSRSRFAKVGDLDAPLDLLEQHGWIRRVPEPERTGPGRRPSPAYLVHPDLAAETA